MLLTLPFNLATQNHCLSSPQRGSFFQTVQERNVVQDGSGFSEGNIKLLEQKLKIIEKPIPPKKPLFGSNGYPNDFSGNVVGSVDSCA